jgi:hypothetical protein
MGIEDRLREDLRGSARTATGADALRGLWHPAPHRPPERGVVVQVKTVAVALAASVVTVLWFVIAVHWRSRPSISRIRRCSPSGQGRPSTVEC